MRPKGYVHKTAPAAQISAAKDRLRRNIEGLSSSNLKPKNKRQLLSLAFTAGLILSRSGSNKGKPQQLLEICRRLFKLWSCP